MEESNVISSILKGNFTSLVFQVVQSSVSCFFIFSKFILWIKGLNIDEVVDGNVGIDVNVNINVNKNGTFLLSYSPKRVGKITKVKYFTYWWNCGWHCDCCYGCEFRGESSSTGNDRCSWICRHKIREMLMWNELRLKLSFPPFPFFIHWNYSLVQVVQLIKETWTGSPLLVFCKQGQRFRVNLR